MSFKRNENFPRLSVVLPMKEIDPFALIEESERLYDGVFDAFILYDHIVLDPPDKKANVQDRLYTSDTQFLEPLMLAAALSQITSKSNFITGVLVAPQRQTALLAQQSAIASLISHERFELGMGVGWNRDEYRAMGQDFSTRGKRLNQQISIMQKLWAGESVSEILGSEEFDNVALSITPKEPIPIWIGGWAQAAIKRAAEYSKGWIPMDTVERYRSLKPILLRALSESGRDENTFRTMGRVALGTLYTQQAVDNTLEWQDSGVTDLALSTTGSKNNDIGHHTRLIYEYLNATEKQRWL